MVVAAEIEEQADRSIRRRCGHRPGVVIVATQIDDEQSVRSVDFVRSPTADANPSPGRFPVEGEVRYGPEVQ